MLVLNAELALRRGEADQALHMLKNVPDTNPHFASAKVGLVRKLGHVVHRVKPRAFE